MATNPNDIVDRAAERQEMRNLINGGEPWQVVAQTMERIFQAFECRTPTNPQTYADLRKPIEE